MSAPIFQRYLLETYPALRERFPQAGRRELRLRVVDEFFRLDASTLAAATAAVGPSSPTEQGVNSVASTKDADPVDAHLGAAPGIIVRTDYSNDAAWSEFYALLRESEAEILSEENPKTTPSEPGAEGEDESDSSSDEQDEAMTIEGTNAGDSAASTALAPLTFFSVLDFTSDTERAQVIGVPNIALLRLVADADVRPAPAVPQGTKRVKPGHRLVDLNGFQEIYHGRSLWVYDAQSNVDGALQMINLEGDVYGTATGDSCRVRASYVTEMQVNMAFHGMTVNFGGEDRWSGIERKRNLDYATAAAQ